MLAGMSPGVSGKMQDGSVATNDCAATDQFALEKSSPAVHEPLPIIDPRLRRVAGLPVNMAVSLGETVLPLETVLQLGIGSRVVFDKKSPEHATIKLNGLAIDVGIVSACRGITLLIL